MDSLCKSIFVSGVKDLMKHRQPDFGWRKAYLEAQALSAQARQAAAEATLLDVFARIESKLPAFITSLEMLPSPSV